MFNNLYSLEKELIALEQTGHEIGVFHFNLRFVQNVIQTINPIYFTKFGMQQSCMCHEVPPDSSDYCHINPLFATGWKYGHAHFWRLTLVFVVKSYVKCILQ